MSCDLFEARICLGCLYSVFSPGRYIVQIFVNICAVNCI